MDVQSLLVWQLFQEEKNQSFTQSGIVPVELFTGPI